MKTRTVVVLYIALLVASIVAHHADYLYQAAAPGRAWWTWIDLRARAPHWGFFDFIPHDGWHLVQSIRNGLWLLGPIAATYLGLRFRWWLNVLLAVALYSVGRTFGFTLFSEWLF